MKLCRFTPLDDPQDARLGVVLDDGIREVTDITASLPLLRWPLEPGDQMIAHLALLRSGIVEVAASTPPIPRERVRLLAPVANPGKFVGGAGNWKHHGAPMGATGLIIKASSSLAGPDEGVHVSWSNRPLMYEPELAIIIGRKCRNVSAEDALSYVAGYTCALDMTMQYGKEDYSFCKSFDSFGMLGPWMVTADEIADPSRLSYRFWVNDELRGQRNFSDLTGNPAELVAFASTAMTLHPGDVILSGAADVEPVAAGDVLKLDIPGIGVLTTKVFAKPHAVTGPFSEVLSEV